MNSKSGHEIAEIQMKEARLDALNDCLEVTLPQQTQHSDRYHQSYSHESIDEQMNMDLTLGDFTLFISW